MLLLALILFYQFGPAETKQMWNKINVFCGVYYNLFYFTANVRTCWNKWMFCVCFARDNTANHVSPTQRAIVTWSCCCCCCFWPASCIASRKLPYNTPAHIYFIVLYFKCADVRISEIKENKCYRNPVYFILFYFMSDVGLRTAL